MNRELLDRVCKENKIHPFWLVYEAYLYSEVPHCASQARRVCDNWHKLDVLPEVVTDFCIDILAKRITLRQPNMEITRIAKQLTEKGG